jgi:TP901 family phage tail tape measure protein
VKRIGTAASSVRKTLAFMRAALVAVASIRVFSSLTRDLVDFSDQMLVVKAITNATTTEFMRLREVAKGLGASTRFTAAEAAEGMAFLARAGFEVNEVIGGIPATLDLAAAAQLDLGRAADIASNLMTSFGRTTAELPDIIDTLVFTANNANTNVQQLADGLKLFAPIASQLGISLKDASAAMAILGDAGIQASLAGTGMRRVITDLEAPTGALAKALDFMNIKFEEVRPSAVGFTGALQRLKDANVGASAASLLFGKRGGFIAAELLRSLDSVDGFRKALERIEGTSKRVAAEMESGLGGALRLVRSAFQNLIISFADLGAEEALNQFFRGLAEVLRAIARNADDVVRAFKVLFAVLVVRKVLLFSKAIVVTTFVTSLLGGASLAAAAQVGILTSATNALKTALLAIPFIRIVTVLGLLVTGFAAFGKQITLTEDSATTLNDVLDTTGSILGDELVNIVNALGFDFEDFGDILDALARKAARAIAGIVAAFFGLIAAVKGIFARVRLLFLEFLSSIGDLQDLIASGFNKVLDSIGLGEFKIDLSDSTTEAEALKAEIAALTKEIEASGGVLESFARGGRDFLDKVRLTTSRRLREALLAVEDAKRDRPNQALPAPVTATGGNRTDLAEALRGGTDEAAREVERLTEALRNLESAHFPLLAVLDAEAEAQKIINEARAKGIELRVSEEELIRRVIRSQLGANMTVDQAAGEQRALKAALEATIISLEEYEVLSRKAAITFLETQRDAASGIKRAFLKIQDDITDAASQIEAALTNAFNNAEDALVEFFATGEFNIKKFVDDLTRDFIRINIRKLLAPAFGALGLEGARDPGAAVAAGGATAAATIQTAMVAGGTDFEEWDDYRCYCRGKYSSDWPRECFPAGRHPL